MAAFGIGGLTVDEFWGFTLIEVLEFIEAAAEEKSRQFEAQYYRTAWLAAHIMNTQGRTLKHPVTAERLLGKKQNGVGRVLTPEEREKAISELVKKFEA